MSVDENAPAPRVVKAKDQLQNCGLARAAAPDQGDSLTRGNAEREPVYNGGAAIIPERDVLKDDFSAKPRGRNGAREIVDARHGFQHFENALAGNYGIHKLGR